MNRKLLLSGLLMAAIVVTLLPKLMVFNKAVHPDETRFLSDATQLLKEQGFKVEQVTYRRQLMLHSTGKDCELDVGLADVKGSYISVHQNIATNEKLPPFRYRYAGSVVDTFPRIWPALFDYAQRLAYRAGGDFSVEPILALSSEGNCADSAVDWTSLRLWATSPDT